MTASRPIQKLLSDVSEVGPTRSRLVGRVQIVAAPETETGQPMRQTSDEFVIGGIVVQHTTQISVTRGSPPVVVVVVVVKVSVASVVETVGRV